jgi:ATP-dependent DNA helicase UvrD/PcrA
MFHADLHIHSRYSRACSKNCDPAALAWWAVRKGITVVGTGDFTHPAWAAELAESLEPAEPGLFRLRPGLQAELVRTSPGSCDPQMRFLLSAEISTIYRRDEVTRKVHHLLYAPTFEAASQISASLAKIGNLASDGRPILGLDSRHLLEITLSAGPGCYLVPAHIWTPWFAVLGSRSGFGSISACYRDLAEHVFAVETGLSSDPAMNWMCSALDGYRLVSNSDAHSPPMIGREATTFGTELDYFAMAAALRTGIGLAGTVNFHPEGGRYHLDGHRTCGIRFEPAQSSAHGGICPVCGKPLTIGVLHRVSELADRPLGYQPAGAAPASHLVSLPEVVSEIHGSGPHSKKVTAEVDRLVAALGPELHILLAADPADISRAGGSLLGEAVTRLRRGDVIKEAGYDGQYGVIRLLRPGELAGPAALFDLPASVPAALDSPVPGTEGEYAPGRRAIASPAARPAADQPEPGRAGLAGPGPAGVADMAGGSLLAGLDPEQRVAAEAAGPLMIIAGPGTGKTRTLTHRIAAEVTGGLPPAASLALTFTRRAAQEMRERLAALIPRQAGQLTVTTFHGLGLLILREHASLAGLATDFAVADDRMRLAVAAELTGSDRAGRRLLASAAASPERHAEFARALAGRGLVDVDGLVELPLALLRGHPAVAASLTARWRRVSVDEYQDIDASQYGLLRLLAGDGSGLTVIGDPDQAIYRFRGADVGFFLRFAADYPGAATVQLTRNYRSDPAIVAGALQAIAPATLVPGRRLTAAGRPPAPARAGAPAAGITFHECPSEQAEAAWIAATIDRLLGGSSFHSLDTGRADGYGAAGLGLADIAVLYRTDAQAGPIGQALTRAGFGFQKRTHDLLLRRTAVPEIVQEMRLADPAAAGPAGAGRAGPLAGRPAGAGEAAAVAARLAAAAHLLSGRAPGEASGPRAVDVLAGAEVLAPLARRCGDDLERFFTEITLGAEADALDPRADAVTLLTLHAAKGLEFGVVFMAGCERGLLPLWLPGAGGSQPGLAQGGGTDLSEERRLLFVGMTRARTHLYLTCAAERRRHGRLSATGPSPLLAAISPALLARAVAAPRPRRPADRQLRLL